MEQHMGNLTETMPWIHFSTPEDPASYLFAPHRNTIILHAAFMLFASLILMPAALILRTSRYSSMLYLAWLGVSVAGFQVAVMHHAVSPDLYPNAIHRRLGIVMLAALIVTVVWKSIFSLAKIRSFFTHDPYTFTRLEQDEVVSRSEDSERSSETLCRSPDNGARDVRDGPEGNQKLVRNHYWDFALIVLIVTCFLAHYTQILLGIVTFCGIFIDHEVFNGLAHWVKASVFLLFGIWVFIRYLGGFAARGHAWNDTAVDNVTAESIECGLICFYGFTNLFLERLGHTSDPISHTDIQHMSIALMFAVGGAIGLLLESRRVQRLLFSGQVKGMYNVMPALVIFFTGMLMSQHHQDTEFASVVHAIWGYYFCIASILRLLTYMLMFTSQKSVEPKRPPTEALVAFTLIAGAVVFMLSARDVVQSLENYNIGTMFVISLSVAGSLLIMMWTIYTLVLQKMS